MPAEATRLRASSCSAVVSHHGFALLGRPGKIAKPASAMGREMMPGWVSVMLCRGCIGGGGCTVDDEEPAPPGHAVDTVQVLVRGGLEVAAEHDGDVVRYKPHTGALEHFFGFVPRAEDVGGAGRHWSLEQTKQETRTVDVTLVAHLRLGEGDNRP